MDSIIVFISEHWLALVAALVNFLWVALEYRASVWLWPVGIVLPLFYIALSWEALFLGNILVNVYYLITSIIGWVMWLRHRGEGEDSPALAITEVSRRAASLQLAILALLYYPLYLLLKDNSSMPWVDALATLISFLGMVYLSRKQIQHWFCWIIANSLSAYIFYHSGDYISAVVFSVNLCMSVFGYIHWRREMQQALSSTPQD